MVRSYIPRESIGTPGRRNSDCESCFSFAERHKLRFRFLSMLAIPAELPYINYTTCMIMCACARSACSIVRKGLIQRG